MFHEKTVTIAALLSSLPPGGFEMDAQMLRAMLVLNHFAGQRWPHRYADY